VFVLRFRLWNLTCCHLILVNVPCMHTEAQMVAINVSVPNIKQYKKNFKSEGSVIYVRPYHCSFSLYFTL
jgi:hypothetical protein